MATGAQWAGAYARQAKADFETFEMLQKMPVPECHRLLFLQMACEKLVKAHLCGPVRTDPTAVQTSHAYVAGTLPVVLRQQAASENYRGTKAAATLNAARHLAQEIEVLTPSVTRDGQRPDNCEYPWEDSGGTLHTPLEWSFPSSRFLLQPAGRTILKLIRGAIDRLVT